MKKKLLSLLLVGITAFSFVGCGGNGVSLDGFELGHFDGSDTSAGWDTDLLYKNTSEFLGGDSGVIWVSEEQDPEYGGYFYQYMSECGHVHNNNVPSNNKGETAVDKNDAAYTSHIAISRSKDLYDWELVGAVDNGLGMKLGLNAFMNKGIWAPEAVYCPCSCEGECEVPNQHKKYFMYFGGQASADYVERMNKKYGDDPQAGIFGTLWTAGVAVSDTPVGPFEIVTSENVYDGGPNLNGDYLTEDMPTFDFAKWFGFENTFQSYNTDYDPFFDANGDLYLVFNSSGTVHKGEENETQIGLSCWGMKMKDMVTPDWSTITYLMGAADRRAGLLADDGPQDASKPWRNGNVKDPVRVTYKGDPTKNAAISPYYGTSAEGYEYEVNEEFVNDPAFPRDDPASYIQWEEWQDGTPNTPTLPNGSPNPHYNAHTGNGSGSIREGVQLIGYPNQDGEMRYYLSFTYTGIGDPLYNVHFAVSSSPLGNGGAGDEFTIPKGKEFSMSIGVSDPIKDDMSAIGHHDYVDVNGEWWIVHWEWSVPFGERAGTDIGRIYAVSPMTWFNDPITNGEYLVPVANGPTKYLQPKTSVASGYKNIASRAKVSATNAVDGTVQYLTDGYTVAKSIYADCVLQAKKETKITLEFSEPQTIRGVLVYNSFNYANAFSKVAGIQFELAETPSWYDGEAKSCYIRDLGFPLEVANAEAEVISSSIASVATFDEIKVTKITINIKDHLGDSEILNIAEVMVLGK